MKSVVTLATILYLWSCTSQQPVSLSDLEGKWMARSIEDTSKTVKFIFKNNRKVKVETLDNDTTISKWYDYNVHTSNNQTTLEFYLPQDGKEKRIIYLLLRRINYKVIKAQIQNSGSGQPVRWETETANNTTLLHKIS